MISKELKNKSQERHKEDESIDLILLKARTLQCTQIPVPLGIWICLAFCDLIIKTTKG